MSRVLRLGDGSIGAYVPFTNGAWTQNFDFTVSDGGWIPRPDPVTIGARANYIAGVGWSWSNGFESPTWRRRAAIAYAWGVPAVLDPPIFPSNTVYAPPTTQITGFSTTFDFSTTKTGATIGCRLLLFNPTQYVVGFDPLPSTTVSDRTFGFADENYTSTAVDITLETAVDSSEGSLAGSALIKSASVSGVGLNPFDTVKVHWSDDNFATQSIVEAGLQRGDTGYDLDDFDLGVHVIAAGRGVWYTQADYTQANATELTGLTGVDGDAIITCIRVPLRRLATQALNNDATALQFIYATSTPVSDATLWGVSFNATTATIHAQSEMTPIIDGTTYTVLGVEALETAGANTQVLVAFGVPVGGGDVELLYSESGGTMGEWESRGVLDGDFVRWVVGSTARLWLSGSGDIWYSANGGQARLLQTGNLDSLTEIRGAYGL